MKAKYLFIIYLLQALFATIAYAASEESRLLINEYETQLQTVARDKQAPIKLKLALAYLEEQEEERAVRSFIDALDSAETYIGDRRPSSDEREHYEQALAIYLDVAHDKPSRIAEKILQGFNPIHEEHPHYFLLNFVLAAAHANQGNLKEFVQRFFLSYQVYPDSYMAHKTRAILRMMLWERAKSQVERERQRIFLMHDLREALTRNSKDSTLYKLLIVMSDDDKRAGVLHTYLQELLDSDTVIPRADIFYYVSEALAYDEKELAEQVVAKGKDWYAYSRAVVEAERLLKSTE